MLYRRWFPTAEIAFPATALRNHLLARWVRAEKVAVDVRSGEDLGVAIAVGVHPARMTVHADGLAAHEAVFCASNLAVSRMVVSSTERLDVLRGGIGPHQRQAVLLQMVDGNVRCAAGDFGFRYDSVEAEEAIATAMASPKLSLVGLHGDIGAQVGDSVSYPAAIGDMIAEMACIRDTHGQVLTSVSLGGRSIPNGDWASELPRHAASIDESLDDACATLRYPRPGVALSASQPAITGRSAA